MDCSSGDNMIDNSKRKKIRDFAEEHYRILDDTHGLEHLERTLELAEYLAEKEGADKEIVKIGAMLHQIHDSGKVSKFLVDLGVEKELIGKIVHCVYCSDLENVEDAETIEAKVVYDADKLQVVGPFGIIREIACDVSARDKGFREAIEHTREIEEKCFETLQTETGKEIGRKHRRKLETFWDLFEEMDNANFNSE